MAVGDWHNLNGYEFQETLFGPLVERECMDCGGVCYTIATWPTPRCQGCCARHHGVVPPLKGNRRAIVEG